MTQKGIVLPCSKALQYFMQNKVELADFNDSILDKFSQLDEYDIISALKSWQENDDFILSSLSKMILRILQEVWKLLIKI